MWTIMVAAKLDQSRVLVTKFRQNQSTFKGRSAGQRHTNTDRQTDRQTNSAENKGPSGLQSGQQTDKPVGFLRPNCAPRSECLQFGMPAERRAQFRVPNVPRSRISEEAPFRICEHAQCRVLERTSLQRAYVIPCQQQMGSSAVHRRHRCKNDGPEFWNSNSVIFENFLKFSKRRLAVRLQLIWTVMVAAKLDHSRVLVTKFHQNRSTLKTDRQTDTQTDTQTDKFGCSAENKALQVCTRANYHSQLDKQ